MPELLTRGDGLLKPAEVTGFKSEWWPTSNRNAVRLRVVTPGRNKSEFANGFETASGNRTCVLNHAAFCKQDRRLKARYPSYKQKRGQEHRWSLGRRL